MNMNLKKMISSIAALALSASCFTAFAADFSDVAADNAYKNAIDELVALKIVNGYDDGTFKPDNEITRAEVTKMVVAGMGPSYTSAAESSAATTDFTDCAGHWAVGYINVGVAQKFINGMGDGTFSPDTNVTYSQIVKMLVAALGYTSAAEAAGGYPNGYLQVASSIGVTSGVAGIDADTAVTRGQVAQLINNAIKTPIVAITSWTTDIYGKPVAETEIMDGNGDSGKYQTLLTEYHDAYAVRGRVTATHAQGTVEADQVAFDVEYADNFDEEKIALNKNKADYSDEAVGIDAYFGDTAAADYLFTYAEALIQKDEDDEYHIISIYPYGKNDIVELATDLFEEYDFESDTNTIDFAISETSSKTKTYKLSDDFKAYVNGIEANDAEVAIDTYVDGNKIGTATLIDTPMDGKTSKDGKYDYMMIDYQEWAIIDGTSVGSSVSKVFFDNYQAGNLQATLNVDYEDEDKVYTFVKNGEEVEFDAIAENDVALVTYDVNGKLNDSAFVKLEITDTVVEGTVSSRSKDNNGRPVYDVDGTDYAYVGDEPDNNNKYEYSFEVGTNYIFYLDAKGRIIEADENATAKNYAIIDRVWVDNNDDNKVRMILADGTRVSYVIKKTDVEKADDIAYESAGVLNDVTERLVSFKLNSKNEAYGFEAIELAGGEQKSEYKASTNKVGSAKMNEATQVFDLSALEADGENSWNDLWNDTDNYSTSDLAAGSAESFEDGEEYVVYYGDKSTAGYSRVVVIKEGVASVGVTAAIAIVDSVNEGMVDGAERYAFDLLTAESNGELVSLYIDEDEVITAEDYSRGDVIVYSLSAAGEMKKVTKIFSVADNSDGEVISYADALKIFKKSNFADPSKKYGDSWYFQSGVASWDSSDLTSNNGYARVGFGAIVDRTSNSVTMAQFGEDKISKGDDIQEMDLASDVNVYVYDFNERDRAGSDRITAGAVGNIVKTTVPAGQIDEDEDGNDVYNWNTIESVKNANYAFFKTVDGEITDILVIIPMED